MIAFLKSLLKQNSLSNVFVRVHIFQKNKKFLFFEVMQQYVKESGSFLCLDTFQSTVYEKICRSHLKNSTLKYQVGVIFSARTNLMQESIQ